MLDIWNTDGAQEMWQSVIWQALLDAERHDEKPGKSTSRATMLERHKSHRWFVDGGRDFQLVCDCAGMEPDFVREEYIGGRLRSWHIEPRGGK